MRLFCSFIISVLTSTRIASDNHSSLNTWEKYFLAMQMALENGDVNVERIDDVRTLNTHLHETYNITSEAVFFTLCPDYSFSYCSCCVYCC